MRITATACSTVSRTIRDLIFADIHEDGRYLYPGTGSEDETGRGAAAGTKLNIPVPPGADDAVFAAEWPRVLAHLRKFEPEFILLQAGADSVEGDPITHLRFTAGSHRRAARDLARAGRRTGPRPRARHRRRRLQPHQPRAGLDRGRAGLAGVAPDRRRQQVAGPRTCQRQLPRFPALVLPRPPRHIQYNSRPPEVRPARPMQCSVPR